jgi:predicted DNA binding protein
MSVIVEFSLSSPRLNLHDATTAVPDVTLEVESVDSVGDGHLNTVILVAGEDLDAFDEAIREDSTVTDVTLLDQLPNHSLYRYRYAEETELRLYPVWLELGAAQLHIECQDGTWFLRIRFPNRDALAEFESICQEENVEFTLHRIYGESGESEPDPLTDAQREALGLALEAGYLDVPRSASLSVIADELDVSEQSASERLRRATRNLATDALSDREN